MTTESDNDNKVIGMYNNEFSYVNDVRDSDDKSDGDTMITMKRVYKRTMYELLMIFVIAAKVIMMKL